MNTQSIAENNAPGPLATPPSLEPYKFLDYFEEADEPKFAGRDRDITEVISRVTSSRTFVLFGRSGLGKTSLLKAGIFPRLRERGFLPVYVRTLTAPLPDLIAALSEEAGKVGLVPLQSLENKTLSEQARLWADALTASDPLVIVFDQFEEFFIRFRERLHDEARAAFVAAVAAMVDDLKLEIRVVFSLREDYLAELDTFGRQLPGLLDKRYRLATLSAFGAREAIVRPLRHAEIPFSQTLVTRLVDMLSNVGFDPSMLQIVCTEVYGQAVRRDQADLRMTEDDFTRIGEFDGIFRRYLDTVTKSFAPEDLLLARTVLDAMITREDTKQATTVRSLGEARFRATEAEIDGVLRILDKSRLIRRDVRDGQDWYELSHERLVPYVREWLNLDKDFLNFRIARDLVTNSSHGDHWRSRPDTLLNRGQIEGVVEPFQERLRLIENQIEFLLRSAIWSRSPDIRYWYEIFGPVEALEILTDALSDPDDDYRLGAVSTLKYVPDPEGLILQALNIASGRRGKDAPKVESGSEQEGDLFKRLLAVLKSAMADRREVIRYTLGQSYAAIHKAARSSPPRPAPAETAPDTKPSIREKSVVMSQTLRLGNEAQLFFWNFRAIALRAPRSIRERGIWGTFSHLGTRLFGNPPELEMMVGAAMDGDRLEEFPWLLRSRARKEASKRFQTVNAEGFRLQAVAGSKAGALAGAAWMLVTLNLILMFQEHLDQAGQDSTNRPFLTNGSLAGSTRR